MRQHVRQHGLGYLIAVVATGVVGGLRYASIDLLGDAAAAIPFVLPVILAAWYGGLYPGLMATALCVLTSDYLFTPPAFAMAIESAAEGIALSLFTIAGVTISYLCESLHVARRRIEAQRLDLERLIGELRDADRRKDEFVATLAHELRNPLAPIRNAVQILKAQAPQEPEVAWSRDVIDRQVGQMVRLLEDLLDVSRITRGKLQLRKSRVALASVLEMALETSRPHVETGRHALTVELPPEPVYLDADAVRLAQVFSNLLNNAAKYSPEGSHIRLDAERHGQDVVVTVGDDGIGIAPDTLSRVFEMFSQAKAALERAQGGLGIGLSLAKGVVEMHGGTITAHSDGLGKGSAFRVRLATVAAQALQADVPEHDGRPGRQGRDGRQGGCKILVADDNHDAAESLAFLLRSTGHDVRTAHDGEQAVDVAETHRPDVVLLDIGMPRLNGYQAARRIRQTPWGKAAKLVALTGWGQEEDKRQAREAGFDSHMVKPVDPATLETFLQTVVTRERTSPNAAPA
jgi:signal transduction histidine kinase/CheY-like chemotaxis protein